MNKKLPDEEENREKNDKFYLNIFQKGATIIK